MSAIKHAKISYRCSNDCSQLGCPGHTMQVISHNTPDTVEILIDGKHCVTFNDNEFIAMLTSYENKSSGNCRGKSPGALGREG